jgi:hypothetical protein
VQAKLLETVDVLEGPRQWRCGPRRSEGINLVDILEVAAGRRVASPFAEMRRRADKRPTTVSPSATRSTGGMCRPENERRKAPPYQSRAKAAASGV